MARDVNFFRPIFISRTVSTCCFRFAFKMTNTNSCCRYFYRSERFRPVITTGNINCCSRHKSGERCMRSVKRNLRPSKIERVGMIHESMWVATSQQCPTEPLSNANLRHEISSLQDCWSSVGRSKKIISKQPQLCNVENVQFEHVCRLIADTFCPTCRRIIRGDLVI